MLEKEHEFLSKPPQKTETPKNIEQVYGRVDTFNFNYLRSKGQPTTKGTIS